MREGEQQADLLPVALRQLPDGAIHLDVEPSDQVVGHRRVVRTASTTEPREVLRTGHALEELQVARQISDPGADRHAVPARVETEELGRSRRRALEVEQRPDRRRLPGAVGPQEAEHLAWFDVEVDVLDATSAAVALRQLMGLDHRRAHDAELLSLSDSWSMAAIGAAARVTANFGSTR